MTQNPLSVGARAQTSPPSTRVVAHGISLTPLFRGAPFGTTALKGRTSSLPPGARRVYLNEVGRFQKMAAEIRAIACNLDDAFTSTLMTSSGRPKSLILSARRHVHFKYRNGRGALINTADLISARLWWFWEGQ